MEQLAEEGVYPEWVQVGIFHYSDHFADPLIQDVPSEWEGASESELEQYVYDYTAYIMEQLAEEGGVSGMGTGWK